MDGPYPNHSQDGSWPIRACLIYCTNYSITCLIYQSFITCLIYQSFIQGASTFLSWAAGPSHSIACKQHNLLFDGKVIINLGGNEDGNDLKSYRFVILLSAWCLQESSKIFSRKISPKHSFTFHVKTLIKKDYRRDYW